MSEPGTRTVPGSLLSALLIERCIPAGRWIKWLINARMLVCVCACHAFMRMHGWPRHGHRLLAYAPVRQFPS